MELSIDVSADLNKEVLVRLFLSLSFLNELTTSKNILTEVFSKYVR